MSQAQPKVEDGAHGGDGNDDVPDERQLLQWLNKFLLADYQQIEDLRDSIAFAQIMDAAIPDSIPLDLFDYNASSYESFYRNANLLRAALDSVNVSNAGIDPDKIAVGQLEANFSLLIFCYTFITTENPLAVQQYDAVRAREKALRSQGLTTTNKFLRREQHPPARTQTTKHGNEEVSATDGSLSAPQDERVQELKYLVASLETEMTSRIMSLNVLTENIRTARSLRDHYFDKLNAVEKACGMFIKSSMCESDAEAILNIMDVPPGSLALWQDTQPADTNE